MHSSGASEEVVCRMQKHASMQHQELSGYRQTTIWVPHLKPSYRGLLCDRRRPNLTCSGCVSSTAFLRASLSFTACAMQNWHLTHQGTAAVTVSDEDSGALPSAIAGRATLTPQ